LPLAVSRTPSANFPCCVSRSWGFFFIWIFIGAFWFRFIVWEGGSSFGSCKDSQQIRNVLCYDALDSLSLVCLSALTVIVWVLLASGSDCHRLSLACFGLLSADFLRSLVIGCFMPGEPSGVYVLGLAICG
jgi:hypothetical protein